jgi:hypothetical protein
MIAQFCQPVYEWFSDAMELIGYRSASVVTWTPPRREMIDPVKETEGMKQLIRSGMDSWQNQVRKLGRDPQDVIRELKIDHELFISANIVPESDPAFDPNRLNRTDTQPNP